MAQIEVQNAVKVFRVLKKKPGLLGAVTAFFRSEYREVNAVDRLDFSIEAGELVGFIGANGAGKSTTVKMLAGVMQPTSGHIRVLGRDPVRDRVDNAQDISAVFGQKTQLWWDLPAIESFQLIQKIYDVPADVYRRNLDRAVTVLGLGELLHQPVRQMSLGQRMRCDLAIPFLHEPKIVYLDEPTIGLDVSVKSTIRTFLRDICREKGITLFLTTHDLRDIEEVANRVILIDRGHKLYDGAVPGLRRTFGDRRLLTLELFDPFREDEFRAEFQPDDNGIEVRIDGLTISIGFDPSRMPAMRLVDFALAQNRVRDFTLEDAQIEEIVKRVYRGRENI